MNKQTKLQHLRIQKGLSQSELAKISGVNFRTLQDFDQGRKSLANAKGEMIYRLSHALDCTADYLLQNSFACGTDIIEIKRPNNTTRRLQTYYNLLNSKELYDNYYHFPIIVESDEIDMSRIYPTKQQLALDIHDALKPNKDVISVVLFGSSITMKCTNQSDTDLAVRLVDTSLTHEVRNDVSEIIQEICDWNSDILWFDSLSSSDRIYHDICKGVQIL